MTDQPVFRAIAHPVRRDIMAMLASQELSIGAVAGHFEMTRPAVAKHLKILREAGLIRTHQQGRETFNYLDSTALKAVANWLEFYSQFWDEKLELLKTAIEEDDD